MQLPLAFLVPRDRARLDERADGLLDEEGVAAGARDDAVAQLRGYPLERRLDDSRGLLVVQGFEDELREVRSGRARVRRAWARALREEEQDRHARSARREEP